MGFFDGFQGSLAGSPLNPLPPSHNPFGLADFQNGDEARADFEALYGKTPVPPVKTLGPNTFSVSCYSPYPYGSSYRPCFLAKDHKGRHEHASQTAAINVTATSENLLDPDPIIVTYDVNGRPHPATSFQKGFEHCSETQKYEHNSIVVTIKGHGTRVIWPGKAGLGFIYYVEEGFTIVRIYEIKNKTFLSTKWFNGTMTKDQIRDVVFSGTVPASEAKEEAKKGGKPYKATFRHLIMGKAEFDKKFKPNSYKTIHYHSKNDDTSLKSIGEMLRSASSAETEAGNAPAALNNAHKQIRDRRNLFLKTATPADALFPAVEVYAIWHNFDFDAKLIYSSYDASEPLYYLYNVFQTAQEMDECPT